MTSVPSTDENDSAALVERRLGRRHRVFLGGKALARDRVIDVTFRDLSARGARLLVTESIAHAGELPVLLLREGLILRSRIIWARPPMFGLEIREAIDAEGECPPQFDALAEAWRCWKIAQSD
jgi:PilZ domain